MLGINMIEIRELEKEAYKGKVFTVKYKTKGYYDIEKIQYGFDIQYRSFETKQEKSFTDVFFF